MHPVPLDKGEIDLLRQAKAERDWTILPTFKLKYLYQRLIAFPVNDISAVKDIAKQARLALDKSEGQFEKNVKDAFSK